MSQRLAENSKSGFRAALWGWVVWYFTPFSGFLFTVLNKNIYATLDPANIEAFIVGSAAALGITGGAGAYYRDKTSPLEAQASQTPIQPPAVVPAPPVAERATVVERAAVVAPPAVVAAPVVSGALNMQQLRAELKRDEGIRHKIYEDSLGLKTAGIGRLITPDMPEYQMPVGTPVSDDQVQAWFSEDVSSAIADAKAVVDDFDSHPKPVKHALVNMAFNMGRDRLSKFKQTLRLINNRQYEEASAESLNSKWAEQVKSRSARVAGMISSGELSHNLA